MKRIVAVTGTRADYGACKPVFDALHASPDIAFGLIVTGMHLSKRFGNTVDGIRKDGFRIVAELPTLSEEDTPEGTIAFGKKTFQGCVEVFSRERPDVLLVLGDRTEMLSAAQAASRLGIPIAHLHGGESSGSLDDAQRHQITQLSSIHLTSAPQHARAVQHMKPNEPANRIHVVGAPAIDVIKSTPLLPKAKLLEGTEFTEDYPTLLFVQHPDTLDPLPPASQLQPSLEALQTFEGNILMLGANADAGGRTMNAMLQEFSSKRDRCTFRITLPHRIFLSWESVANLLVGNSSSGIIEAASFHLPVVNIGDRQQGRTRSGNVIDVPYDRKAICDAMDRALHDQSFRDMAQSCRNAYGDGGTAERVVSILTNMSL